MEWFFCGITAQNPFLEPLFLRVYKDSALAKIETLKDQGTEYTQTILSPF